MLMGMLYSSDFDSLYCPLKTQLCFILASPKIHFVSKIMTLEFA